MHFRKKAVEKPEVPDEHTADIVKDMLLKLKEGREEEVKRYAKALDNYEGNVLMSSHEIQKSPSHRI